MSLLRLLNLSGWTTSEMFSGAWTNTVITYEIPSAFAFLNFFVASFETVSSPIGQLSGLGHWSFSFSRNGAPLHHRSLETRSELLIPREAMSRGLSSGGQHPQYSLFQRLRIVFTRFCTNCLNCLDSLLIHYNTIREHSNDLANTGQFLVHSCHQVC